MAINGKGVAYTLIAGTPVQVCGINPGRQYLFMQVSGGDRVTIMPDAAPVAAGQGMVLDAANVVSGQGGNWERSGDYTPENAFWALSANGSVLFVFET